VITCEEGDDEVWVAGQEVGPRPPRYRAASKMTWLAQDVHSLRPGTQFLRMVMDYGEG
jgi:hypothetical protein